jgi:predicted short-subunit dehydrogenase-like oxidoreductase (DUF2520 family)
MTKIGLVGPGRVGRAIVGLLPANRYRLRYVVSRGLRSARRAVREIQSGEATADLSLLDDCGIILIATPSQAIDEIVNSLALAEIDWDSKILLAVTGLVDTPAFAALSAAGASVGMIYPLYSFQSQPTSLSGVQFAIEGEPVAMRAARKLIGSLGAEYQLVTPQQKLQAAVAMSIASDFTAGVFEAAVAAAVQAGFRRKRIQPVVRDMIERSLSDYSQSSKNIRPDSILSGNGDDLGTYLAAARRGVRIGNYYEAIANQTLNIIRGESETSQAEDPSTDHSLARAARAAAGS